MTEFSGGVTPGFSANTNPVDVIAGPDGNLWFTEEFSSGRVGRITPSGSVTEFTGGSIMHPEKIAAGPDGARWFTEYGAPGGVVRITPSGAASEFIGGVTPGFSPNGNPDGIAAGPDGNIWFAQYATGRITRITTPPTAVTGGASVLGSGAANVSGSLNGHSQPTSYRFEFGPTTSYGSSTGPVDAGAGSADVSASSKLSGLEPNTTYHYRLDATNPTDTSMGVDATFTTPPLPAVGSVKVAPKTWRRGSRLPQISKRKRRPVGTTITFSLSRAASARLEFFRKKSGRRVKKKCRRQTHKNRRSKRCSRLVLAGAISFAGHSGKNTVRFQGRISKTKKLKPGRYRLKVIATDPTTPTTSSRTASFRIARR